MPSRLSRVCRWLLLLWLRSRWFRSAPCSSFAPTCSPRQDASLPTSRPEKLYNEGVFLLNRRQDYKDAAKKFEEVERQHPYSEWARKSLIMTAYAEYEAQANTTSRSPPRGATSRCIRAARTRPTRNILIGSSYYDQIPDVTRDQGRTEKAIAALEEVTRKYPDSEYAPNAKHKIEMARDQLAGKEMMIGRVLLRHARISPARSTASRSW